MAVLRPSCVSVRRSVVAPGVSAVLLAGLAGAASGQWADNFNRPNGPIGGSWVANGGTFANFSVNGLRGAHTTNTSDAMRHSTALGNYARYAQSVEIDVNGIGSQYVALGTGYGGTGNLFIKVQNNGGPAGFDRIGFYTGLNNTAGWAGSAPTFTSLTTPFTRGRMQTYFTNAGDTLNLAIDTNADGIPDQTYTRNGVNTISGTFGTGFGIGGLGESRFDNWRVDPSVAPALPNVTGNSLLFGSPTDSFVLHQVTRSGLWTGPVRIRGVRFAADTAGGTLSGSVGIDFGYTTRTPGVASAGGGLAVPTGTAGAPNALGAVWNYFQNGSFSQTVTTAGPDNFQIAFDATPGFVYFPGVGNLFMQLRTAITATPFFGASRGAGGPDASWAYTSTLFGQFEDPSRFARVQLIAMPVTPDVLPTWPTENGNAIPLSTGAHVLHQAHHAGTLSPLGDGGKVAIQAVRLASFQPNQTLNGQVRIGMGYTARTPGLVSASGGLSIPNAAADGSPNAAGALSPFFDAAVNEFFATGGPENYAVEFRRSPFVFDPARGNLLVQWDTQMTTGFFASRAAGSAESSRAFRSTVFGNSEDVIRATKTTFVTTPVSEPVLPSGGVSDFIRVPFFQGSHVTHQVFSSSLFGTEPVRIDSIALAPVFANTYTAGELTVRLGYTAREPNQTSPAGLDVPNFAGGGLPNTSISPMADFRGGSFSAAAVAPSNTNFQFVLGSGDAFLYNPALGNLLVEIVSTAPAAAFDPGVACKLNLTSESSLAVNSTTFGLLERPDLAISMKFTYYKDLFPCPADVTGNNVVDLDDFFAFFNCFSDAARCADLDGSGETVLEDFFAFFNAFSEGC